jgi:NADPH:quinone reductase-like Zn-dependent oxidoreductase
MRAVVLRELGDADKLRVETVPDPTPGPGEVVVRVRAAALNHRDVWIRLGKYAGIKLPVVLGSDGAGEVVAVGPDVEKGLVGRAVLINPSLDWGTDARVQGPHFRILGLPDDGTYAELVKVPAGNVHAKPADWTFPEAAALPLAGLTAYRAVVSRARMQPGENVLVTGIGGGVSLFALQIATALGAKVFVTSGSDAKLSRAKQLGAGGGANYKSQDWAKAVVDFTGGAGPDAVIDSVGGETFGKAIEITKPGGRIVTYGATTGAVKEVEVRRIFWKQLSILGSTMGSSNEFAAMLAFYDSHKLRPVIDKTFPLAEAAAAHRRMEAAEQFGKVVLEVG